MNRVFAASLRHPRVISPSFATKAAASPSPMVTKTILAHEIAADHDFLTQAKSKMVVDQVFASIAKKIAAGQKVQITGFGVFETYQSSPRKGVNPSSGQPIDIPAKTRIRFKASSAFKGAVDKK